MIFMPVPPEGCPKNTPAKGTEALQDASGAERRGVAPAQGDAGAVISLPSLPISGNVFLLLTSAGSSVRFGAGKKEFFTIEGKSVLRRALEAFLDVESLQAVVVTYSKDRQNETERAISDEAAERAKRLPLGLLFCEGGETRQDSVYNGLLLIERIAANADMDTENSVVLIHDAARPWILPATIQAVLESVRLHGACIPLGDLPDTPKIIASPPFITAHPLRDSIKTAQTPQGFALGALLRANRAARAEGRHFTDDAALWAAYVGPVAYVPGDRKNRKITYREDVLQEDSPSRKATPDDSPAAGQRPALPGQPAPTENPATLSTLRHGEGPDGGGPIGDDLFADEGTALRVGEGWDIHRLVPGRKLLIGGVHVAWPSGELGHSDGDVLWHAIIDAMLGACALGDIGTYFPPQDPVWAGADSGELARKVAALIEEKGWKIVNLDATVILEKPKLGPCRESIRRNVAENLDIPASAVSFKAKTNEGLGAVGAGEAVEARAVVLVERCRPRTGRQA